MGSQSVKQPWSCLMQLGRIVDCYRHQMAVSKSVGASSTAQQWDSSISETWSGNLERIIGLKSVHPHIQKTHISPCNLLPQSMVTSDGARRRAAKPHT